MELADYNCSDFIHWNDWKYLSDYNILDPFEMSEVMYENGDGDWGYNEGEFFGYHLDSNLIFKL